MLKLANIASNIQKQKKPISSTVVGVVVDVTRPLYREKENNYIVMIKIVDESLNDQKLYGVMSRDCTIYLFSKNPNEINFVKGIGQILLLDKFTFSLWNDIKLQAKYLGTTEGIFNVAVDFNTNQLLTINKFTVNFQLLEVNQFIIERVKCLMEWRSTHLSKIFEPKLGVNVLNNHCVMVQPFNMILKYDSTIASENSNYHLYTLLLKDFNQNTYLVKYNQDCYEQGDTLYIRGIKSIGQSLQLILTQTGNILRFTYHINPNLMNYMAIYRDNQKFMIEQKQNQFTILQYENNEFVYLANLMELQDRYNHRINKDQLDIRDSYFINSVVVNFEGKLSMYHREYQILLHDGFYTSLSEQEKKQYTEFNRIGYVYEGVIGLIDRSNQSKGKPFYAHLFTSDSIGNFIGVEQFEKAQKGIGGGDQSKLRNQLEQKINKKLRDLTIRSSFNKLVSLGLEPIKSEKLLFRVANTKIL